MPGSAGTAARFYGAGLIYRGYTPPQSEWRQRVLREVALVQYRVGEQWDQLDATDKMFFRTLVLEPNKCALLVAAGHVLL